jgi:hypothetical protein
VVDDSPGVVAVWGTLRYEVGQAGRGPVFRMGEPATVRWFASARPASRDEVIESVRTLFGRVNRSLSQAQAVLGLFDRTSR